MKYMRTGRKGGERGTALVTVALGTVTMGLALATSLTVAGRRAELQRNQNEGQKALGSAEAGVDQAIAVANDGQLDFLAEGESTTLAELSLLGATGSVTVNRLPDAVNANTTTKTLRVESTGSCGQVNKKVVGFIRQVITTTQIQANLPVIESAVTLNDPFAQIKFNGTSFLISGSDQNINGTAGPSPSVWGIGVGPQSNGTPGDPNQIISQIKNNQNNLIQGSGGSPSVGSVSAVEIDSVIAALGPAADVTLTNQQSTYTEDLGNYSQGLAQLTYVVGDIHISGGDTGYGILLVDGNLTISGNWNYVGLVFVNGQVTFSGGGNTKKLIGSVFIQGNTQDLDVNGNIILQYSSEAVALITNWLGTKTTTSSSSYSFVSSAETFVAQGTIY